MSMPPKPRKKNPAKRAPGSDGPPGGPPRSKGKKLRRKPKPRKKQNTLLPQIISGVTLVGVLGGVVALGLWLAQRAMPEDKPVVVDPAVQVARPSIEPTLAGVKPKRPGLVAEPPDEIYFPKATDISGSAFEPQVQGLLERHVITVFADGKFRPNDAVPRAEFLVWLYNAVMAQSVAGPDPFVTAKKPFSTVAPTGAEFTDVPEDHWALPVLATLKSSGVFDTELMKTVRPDAPLKREEWAAYAALIAASRDARGALEQPVNATKLAVAMRKYGYTDPAAIKDEYKPFVFFIAGHDKRRAWLGDSFEPPLNPGPWGPNKSMTRGEAATWLGAFYEDVGMGMM